MSGQVEGLKEKGNECMAALKWKEAIEAYTEAITIDPQNAVLYSNRSAALLRNSQYGLALTDADMAIQLQPNWARGYGRRANALYYLSDFEDSLVAYQKYAECDPKLLESQQYKTDVQKVQAAISLAVLPKMGVWANMILPLGNQPPHPILYDTIDTLCDWFVNSGCCGIVAIGPGTEFKKLSFDNSIKVSQKCVQRSKIPIVVFLPETAAKGDVDTICQQIHKFHEVNVKAVIISASQLATNESQLKEVIPKLKKQLGENGPLLGLYDSNDWVLSTDFVHWMVNSGDIQILVDKSGALTRMESLQIFSPSLRILNSSLTTLQPSVTRGGYHGYIGIGSSFFPEVLSWLLKNLGEADWEQEREMVSRFFSVADLTLQRFYPMSAKIFLKFYKTEFNVDAVAIEAMDSKIMEEDVTRLSYLSDTIKFILETLKDESGTNRKGKRGRTVLL